MGCVGGKPKGEELPKGQKYQVNNPTLQPINNPQNNVVENQPEDKVAIAATHPQQEDKEDIQGSGKPVLIQPYNTLNVPSANPDPPSKVHISYDSSNNTLVNRTNDPSNSQHQPINAEASTLKPVIRVEPIAEVSQDGSNKIPIKEDNQEKSKQKQGEHHEQAGKSRIAEGSIEKEKGAAHENNPAESNSYLPIEPLTHLTPAALPVEKPKEAIIADVLEVPEQPVENNSVDLQIAQGLKQLDQEANESLVGQEQYLQFWQFKLPLMLVDLSKMGGQ